MAASWFSTFLGRRAGLPTSLRAMRVVSLLVPLAFLVILTYLDHRRLLAEAHADAARLSAVAKDHARNVIETDLLLLDRMADRIHGLGWTETLAQGAATHDWLRAMDERFAHISALQYADATGEVLLRSDAWPASPVRITGRDWFAALAGGAQVSFGTSLHRPQTGVLNFVIARRLESADGAFLGAAAGSILPDYFLDYWRTLTIDGRVPFALMRTDGQILIAQPSEIESLRTFAEALLPDAIGGPAPEDVGLRLLRLGARQEFLAAFRQIGRYPLLVTAVIPLDRIFATWWHNALITALTCLAAASGLSFATLLACRRWRSEQATLKALHVEAARREAAESGIAQAQRMEALGRLTGGFAHDSNNLLTAILGTVHLLERHLGPDMDARAGRLLGAMREAVNRSASLNRSLLAFARRQKLDPVSLDANALVQDFAPLMRRAIGEGQTLVLVLEPDLPPCRADAGQLETALLNLVTNARHAMPEGGTITLETRRARLDAVLLQDNPDALPGQFIAVSVKDTGLGMDRTVKERAFEPFFTTKPPGRGTGLGLSQVFGFVRQLGGHVGLESTPGIGSRVTLYLPESDAPTPQRHAAPAESGWLAPPARARVMLVEDDPEVREVASQMLEDAGLQVTAMPDGTKALDRIRRGEPFDVLFSDIIMPGGLDGIALAEAARALRPGLPVLLTTGYAGRGAFSSTHAFEVLSKPYEQAALVKRIGALLAAVTPEAIAAGGS